MRHILTLFLLFVLISAHAQNTTDKPDPTSGKADNDRLSTDNSTGTSSQQNLDSINAELKKIKLQLDSLQHLGMDTKLLQDSLKKLLEKAIMMDQKSTIQHQHVAEQLDINSNFQSNSNIYQFDTNLSGEPPQGIDLKTALPNPVTSKRISEFEFPYLPASDLPKMDSSAFSGQNIDEKLEEQILKHNEIRGFKEQSGIANDPLKDYLQMDAEELAQQQKYLSLPDLSQEGLQKQAKEILPDHSIQLEKARKKLRKYNGRFTEIKSLKHLPKNPFKRHPLMGEKWYKRVQPGFQWQLGKGEAFRIDLGPRLSYLVTDKLEIGAAAQARLTTGKSVPSWTSFTYESVWGYSAFGSYEIKKGFYGQISYERLNTQVILLPNQQERSQERLWVEGLRLGAGKRYTIHKNLRGYNLVEYNFSPSIHTPYRQQLQLKVGVMWDRRKH
jgi:hypothetical protein